MTHFDKLNRDKIQRLNNILLEAPFFYRDDDEELFLYLRRNGAAFKSMFDDYFGFELVIEKRSARLLKARWHNKALRPSQHDVFDLTRRDDCIAFLLILEFYEHLLDQQNLSIDDSEPPRFFFGSLFEFARDRLREQLGEAAPSDADVKKSLRALIPQLLRYRFLRELSPEPDDVASRDNLIYECLPGLHSYDIRRLGPQALAQFASRESEARP